MSQIKLQSSNGKCFSVDVKIASVSKTIEHMLEQLGTDGIEDEAIPLPNVNEHTLRKILEWAEYHKDDEPVEEQKEEEYKENNINISDWDREFLEMERERETFIDLVLASNYLDISRLLETCCKFTAIQVKGKTIEEIRKVLKIKTSEVYENPVQDTKASTKASLIETEEEKIVLPA